MEFHPADFENYVKITGNDPTPEAHAAYVDLIHVRHMFVSGELGYDHLINMVARLGIPFRGAPKPLELEEGQVDWSAFPGDGSVIVMVKMYGDWQPGRYWGRVEGGTLGVEMEDNPGNIIEINRTTPDLIRLGTKQPFADAGTLDREDMDARAKAKMQGYEGDPCGSLAWPMRPRVTKNRKRSPRLSSGPRGKTPISNTLRGRLSWPTWGLLSTQGNNYV